MCIKRKNKIIEKRKTVKSNLETQAFKMTWLVIEKFPQWKVDDTVKVRVPDVDRRCDSRNLGILGVIMEVDPTKDLHKIGTEDGILNLLYTRNQFTTCTEGTVNISDVPSIVSLRECAEKASLFGGQGYKRCNCKTTYRNNSYSCRKTNKVCNSEWHNSSSCEIKWHSCWDTPWWLYILFVFLFLPTVAMKSIFLLFFSKEKTSLKKLLPLLLYMYLPQPNLAILHISYKKAVNYTYFLANVLYNLWYPNVPF